MKLASLVRGGRDGTLVVVSHDLGRAVEVPGIAPTLQAAIEDWDRCEPLLDAVYDRLNEGGHPDSFAFDEAEAHSPLPRAYLWCEASVWIIHLERCRKSTNRELPAQLYEEIGMYQGGSDSFVPPHSPLWCFDDDWDADLEAGICVITDDVPMGVTPEQAAGHIKLVLLVNDFSLRRLQIPEMAKGLGVLISKPANAYSPAAVSPKTLGAAWRDHMLARPVEVSVRGERIGSPRGDLDALFRFPQLIAHLARTRDIEAGSIIGAGTVANRDQAAGSACLMEKRAIEILEQGGARTPFLKFGDRIRIECHDEDGSSIFGAIDQQLTFAGDRPVGTKGE
ncbi:MULTISPECIES: fumarylacetoacetate hydrolase family protein [unclassified Sphingomonas]|uniref:fumarylacetoacetate hydrolase family protein n=1 Tax=unclassified Sphingomonas TaxID=196159 RepID=UPI0006F20065|nr:MULTISPECIES: fumarylacetoacetate hydrolase family protein [unclassified Sphingomonas]KQX23396.1 2-keto-4-pentenoate hydratase [Sphingomonas sp. Root1294]KQY68247.1 2-keto-4-pentenoate hydratase [Sphingomonas sp. Root50]KRB91144.1 2-keto-4-pentenoate hydratase [Sphingomonas sp. Root720]